MTIVRPLVAAVGSAVLWALPVLVLAVGHLPLAVVQWHGQAAAAGVFLAAAIVVLLRHDRFELGRIR